jgi:hypothetical protein
MYSAYQMIYDFYSVCVCANKSRTRFAKSRKTHFLMHYEACMHNMLYVHTLKKVCFRLKFSEKTINRHALIHSCSPLFDAHNFFKNRWMAE